MFYIQPKTKRKKILFIYLLFAMTCSTVRPESADSIQLHFVLVGDTSAHPGMKY